MIEYIEYFRPCGNKPIENMVNYAKGSAIKEMRDNERGFISNLSEAVAEEQYGFSKYKGGMIVFSVNVNSMLQDKSALKRFVIGTYQTLLNRMFKNRKIMNVVTDINRMFKDSKYKDMFIGGITIGKFFKGRYVDIETEQVFDETSTSIELGGVPSELLLLLGTKLCREFNQQTALIKDYNTGKIFYVDDSGFEEKDEDELMKSISNELNKTKFLNKMSNELKEAINWFKNA